MRLPDNIDSVILIDPPRRRFKLLVDIDPGDPMWSDLAAATVAYVGGNLDAPVAPFQLGDLEPDAGGWRVAPEPEAPPEE